MSNKILVLGKTGEGKSTLCNYILKYDEKKCKESSKPGSCTQTIDGFVSNHYKDIFMIDTPGLSDSKGKDQEIVENIRKVIKEKHCKGIKSIILVSNINTDRLSFEDKKLLFIYCKMFPVPEFWYHVGIIFSKSYTYFPDDVLNQMKLTKQNEFLKDLLETIKNCTEQINKDLPANKQIQIPGLIQSFFTDCGEVRPPFNHDRTDKEIERLINWTRGNDYLDFFGNDFSTEIDIKYKKKIKVNDRISKKKEKIDENKIKITMFYYETYETIDYFDKKDEVNNEKPYKTEINYIITKEWEDKKTGEKVTKDGITSEKIEKITWKREDIYDENYNLIKEGKPFEKNKEIKSINTQKSTKYTKKHVNYKNEIVYKSSLSEVHKYFKDLKESPVFAKIVWGIANIHPVFLVFNICSLIASKIKKPERWKITERYYRDETWETITYYKDNGDIDYKTPDKLIDTKELPMEPDEPIRID